MASDKKKKNKIPPSKCIITMGEMLTQTQYSGKVSGVNMLNACINVLEDIKTTTGMPVSGALTIIANKFGYDIKIAKIEKNPTMNATKSNETAKDDEAES